MYNPSIAKEIEKYAMPVGTGAIIELNKFLFDQRDKTCTACKNGRKSEVTKLIGDKKFIVPNICVCVPYIQSHDGNGTAVVSYKGQRELWPDLKRPEEYSQRELLKSTKIQEKIDIMKKVRKLSNAHDNVHVDMYVVGANKPNLAGVELRKSMDAPKAASNVKPIARTPVDEFFAQQTKKSAYRNKEGNIVVVDSVTAEKLIYAGILRGVEGTTENIPVTKPAINLANPELSDPNIFVDETLVTKPAINLANPELSDPSVTHVKPISKSEAKRLAIQREKAEATSEPSITITKADLENYKKEWLAAQNLVAAQSSVPVKKGRGRPAGAKNKPKG